MYRHSVILFVMLSLVVSGRQPLRADDEPKNERIQKFLDEYDAQKAQLLAHTKNRIAVAKREVTLAQSWPIQNGSRKAGRGAYNHYTYASPQAKSDVVVARTKEQRRLEAQVAALRRGELVIPQLPARLGGEFGFLVNHSATVTKVISGELMTVTGALGPNTYIIDDEGRLAVLPPEEMTLCIFGLPTAGLAVGEKVSLDGYILRVWGPGGYPVDGKDVLAFEAIDMAAAKLAWEERRAKSSK